MTSGISAIEYITFNKPQLIILEVETADIDGIEICKTIRENQEISSIPIIFLTKHTEDYVQVAAYKAGCDDFINKSIKPWVLTYRIYALLKRNIAQKRTPQIAFGSNFIIDPERFLVIVNEKNIYLPKKQFLLLQYLASQPKKVFSRENISISLWGSDSKVGLRTIDVYIRKIREQIGLRYIKTIKGVGYRFEWKANKTFFIY